MTSCAALDSMIHMYDASQKHHTHTKNQLHKEFLSKWIVWKERQLFLAYDGSTSYYHHMNTFIKDKEDILDICKACTCCEKHTHHHMEESIDSSSFHICTCICRRFMHDIVRVQEIIASGQPNYNKFRYIERKREMEIHRYLGMELCNQSAKLHELYQVMNRAFEQYFCNKNDHDLELHYRITARQSDAQRKIVDHLLMQNTNIDIYIGETMQQDLDELGPDSDGDDEMNYSYEDDSELEEKDSENMMYDDINDNESMS